MRKLNVVRVREGRERIAKDVEVGERDNETGVDFFWTYEGDVIISDELLSSIPTTNLFEFV